MKKQQLKKLKEEVLLYNEKWKAGNKPLRIYDCPVCGKPNQTPMPTSDLVSSKGYWDSLTTCYECGNPYFIVKYPASTLHPNGEILIQTIS